jgi:hypothetical protein
MLVILLDPAAKTEKPMEHAGATYPACPSAFFRQGADTNKAG